jgi:hypothetical protein
VLLARQLRDGSAAGVLRRLCTHTVHK